MTAVATERKTLTIAEAAKELGISVRHAYDMARDGTLPSLRLGDRIVVPRKQLDKLLDGEETRRP